MDKLHFAIFYMHYYFNNYYAKFIEEVPHGEIEDLKAQWKEWSKTKEHVKQQSLEKSELRRDIERFEALAKIIDAL